MADTANALHHRAEQHRQVAGTFYGSLINGPWDMTGLDNGSHVSLWITNVLNGTVQGHGHVVNGGTVLRLVSSFVRIAAEHRVRR